MDVPTAFAIVVTKGTEQQRIALSQPRTVFGRYPPPYTDVCLRDPKVARRLFEIRWNEGQGRHEVQDYGQIYPPSLNGEPLSRGECRLLRVGDVLSIGAFRLEYVEEPAESS